MWLCFHVNNEPQRPLVAISAPAPLREQPPILLLRKKRRSVGDTGHPDPICSTWPPTGAAQRRTNWGINDCMMAKHRPDRDSWGECTYSTSDSPTQLPVPPSREAPSWEKRLVLFVTSVRLLWCRRSDAGRNIAFRFSTAGKNNQAQINKQ